MVRCQCTIMMKYKAILKLVISFMKQTTLRKTTIFNGLKQQIVQKNIILERMMPQEHFLITLKQVTQCYVLNSQIPQN